MGAERLSANAPRVVHETIDGEVIVIDLATGTYFSLQGGAANVWALIAAGYDTQDMVSVLAEVHDQDPGSIKSALDPFLAELQAESLVTVAPSEGGQRNGRPEMTATGAFSASLDKHTDMTELILLDPVHDVDSMGWPHQPAG
jgi:hypothetical protein